VVLSDEERSVLSGWARRRKTAQALALRARIVLACAEDGATIASVSTGLEVSRATVSKWRGRFLETRLDGLSDVPRPGRPRLITDDQIGPCQGSWTVPRVVDHAAVAAVRWSVSTSNGVR